MSIYDFKVQAGDGSQVDLGDHRGQVLVIVNTASKCGFTPQFAGLEALYQQFKDRGVTVIGFPCNQFGNQDPGTNEEIAEFCQVNYGVTFPMMAKIDVKGDDADPLFVWLTGGDDIQWNFTKFVIGRDGEVLQRFDTREEPSSMSDTIEKALSA